MKRLSNKELLRLIDLLKKTGKNKALLKRQTRELIKRLNSEL